MKNQIQKLFLMLLVVQLPVIILASSQNVIFNGKYVAVISEWEEEEFTINDSTYHWEFIFPEEGTMYECDGKHKINNKKLILYNRICTFVRNDPNNPPPYLPEKKKDRSYEIRNITKESFELHLVKDEFHDDDKGWIVFRNQ